MVPMSRSPSSLVRAAALAVTATLALAACQTQPLYRPQETAGGIGYRDQQLAQNRYRITFSGGVATHREQVEDFLLRRAAEVTQRSGYTHFRFDDRDTEARTTYHPTFDPFFRRWDWWRYGPRYRPWYWTDWDYPYGPYGWDDPFPTTRYTAYAEIVMLTSGQAEGDPNAIEAADVLAHLAPPAAPPTAPTS